MKKTITLFLLYQFVLQAAFPQNVGIGTTAPQSKLDINGDIALRSADITISTTYTYALNVNTVKQSNYKLKHPAIPIGNFILAGIAAGVEGRIITLTNRTPSSMEIYNEDVNATAANRIQTGTGNTVAIYPNGNVTLQYDATDQRWSIKAMHNNSLDYFGGNSGTSYWDLAGQNISNTNTGNVGIGTNSPAFKLDIIGEERINGSAITTPGFNGGLTSGGSLRIENSSNNFFLKADGGKIQAEKSNLQTSGSTASTLLINPYGGNVGINYSTPLAQLFVRKTNNTLSPEGSFACFGTTYGSYFHYGSSEDTYIRGGKDGSKVIINDGTLGKVGIGTTNPAAKLDVQGDFRISGAMYEPFLKIGWTDFTLNQFGLRDKYAVDYNASGIKNIIVDIPSDIGCNGYRPVSIYLPDPFPGNIYGNYLGQVLNISISRNTLNAGAAGITIIQATNNGDVTIGHIYADLCQNNSGSFRPVSFIKVICDGTLWQPIEGGFSR